MGNISKINEIDFCNSLSSFDLVTQANITSVNLLDKSCASCTAISLTEGGSCNLACRGSECRTFYTTGTPGSLVVGDYIYRNSECTECTGRAFLSDSPCRVFNQGCFTLGPDCAIVSITGCK